MLKLEDAANDHNTASNVELYELVSNKNQPIARVKTETRAKDGQMRLILESTNLNGHFSYGGVDSNFLPIRNPLITKKTSTPRYPCGNKSGSKWYATTATTANARRPWIFLNLPTLGNYLRVMHLAHDSVQLS